MKQEYIKIRNSGNYPVEWFYKYFLENGGENIGLQYFHNKFKFINLDDVLSFLDGKFNLVSVHAPLKINQNILGDFIKVVE